MLGTPILIHYLLNNELSPAIVIQALGINGNSVIQAYNFLKLDNANEAENVINIKKDL
jgi:hypothetical protein